MALAACQRVGGQQHHPSLAGKTGWHARVVLMACGISAALPVHGEGHKAESVTCFPVAGRPQGKQQEMLCLPWPLTFGVFVAGCCS